MGRVINQLEGRIGDQLGLISSQLRLRPSSVSDFYWPAKRPSLWGVAAIPKVRWPVWQQLLFTPTLIVDILPCNADQFVELYGLTIEQAEFLAEAGHIVPNFYHYKDNGWHEYARFSKLAGLMTAYGRPNTEWITRFLDYKYGFAPIEKKYTEFFASIELSPSEQARLKSAAHGRIPEWSKFASVNGQRLAYLKVLGRGKLRKDATEYIQGLYRDPSTRVLAVKAIVASKHMVASPTTAAFGGLNTFVPEQIAEVLMTAKRLDMLSSRWGKRAVRLPEPQPRGALEYAWEMHRRAGYDAIPDEADQKLPRVLDGAQFKRFASTLEKVRDGRLGILLDRMTKFLAAADDRYRLKVQEYSSLEREIESGMRPFRSTAKWLRRIGCIAIQAEKMKPDKYDHFDISVLVHSISFFFGGIASIVESVPFVPGLQVARLCGSWTQVSDALKLKGAHQT